MASAALTDRIMKVPGPLGDECWLYQGKTTRGVVCWQGEVQGAARLSYLTFVGPIKLNHYICHRCDVPGCINPAHLFQGTPQDNVQDAIAKGRFHFSPGGEASPAAKLTEAKVSSIKSLINAGIPMKKIASEFDLSYPHVCGIKVGDYWAWVEPKIINLSLSCAWCGQEFIPRRQTSRFCLRECQIRWHNNKKRRRKRPTWRRI